MVLDKYVEFNLNGKTHKMCYPVKYVFEAERHLSDGNLMVLVSKAANGVPPTVNDMFTLIKYAIIGGDPKLTEDEAEELYLEAVSEITLVEMADLAMQALRKSGVLGQEKKAPAAPKA